MSDQARKRRNRKRRLWVYGTLLALIFGFWSWQPWEFDIIPRRPPVPNPSIDPDRERLFAPGTRILIVTAHPDDSEFYVGGILTQLAKTAELHQVLVTDGDKGYYPFEDHEENRRVRQSEARAAAERWKAKSITFLGFPDGRVRAKEDLVQALENEIKKIQPEYVLAFDGEFPPRMSHQDHRRAGDATLIAAKRSGIPKWILLFSTIAPNFVVDITDDWDAKKELLAIHKSQFHGERLERVTNMVASTAETDGERIEVALGEGFRSIRLKE